MRLAVSGDRVFLDRYRPMLQALAEHAHVDTVYTGNLSEWLPVRIYNRLTRGTRLHDRLVHRDPHPSNFATRSRLAEQQIAKLTPRPDVLMHVFSSYAPQWKTDGPPYTLYLDYTMAQAKREYPLWADFHPPSGYARWARYERTMYERARHIFSMTPATKAFLESDFRIAPERITVVGSGGSYPADHPGTKTFGTHRLFFDGSDWYRKGGDTLASAFNLVRRTIPSATLVVVGGPAEASGAGIENPGLIRDRGEMTRLFLSSDLVVAPARCDPMPGFVIEAMHYGVPCVVSAENGMASMVRESGSGVVVEDRSPDAYAAAIEALLRSPGRLQEMSANGRRMTAERLNWTFVAGAMLPGLKRAAGEGGRGGV